MKLRKTFILILIPTVLFSAHLFAQAYRTPFEKSQGRETATYAEAIEYFRQLDSRFTSVELQETGATDDNVPLHVVYFSADGNFNPQAWKKEQRLVILINNAIHPGEPDGVDASMMLIRDAALGRYTLPRNIVLAVIPVFNTGGARNRGRLSRANQNGPAAYGFRGNAQNLDLNRDFIKMDARETRSLVQLFHRLDPDLFIDNHVSNGADYQHVMTLLSENERKLGSYMGAFQAQKLEPEIYRRMKVKGYDLVPYVNHWGHTPDKGWPQFYDPPRFASGFAALFATFAFVSETHMLKPYAQRVQACYALMQCMIDFAAEHAQSIKAIRARERQSVRRQKVFTLDWRTDTTQYSLISFKGYASRYKTSEVSGQQRLFYDRQQPYERQVRFFNRFLPTRTATAPQAYILPRGWHKVLQRLQWNGVQFRKLERDTDILATVYTIGTFETVKTPYEGHYLHKDVHYTAKRQMVHGYKGDYIIPTDQPAKRYLLETLEPDAPDAFFAWGFFDAILQQKEGFSDYVFEDLAAGWLKLHPEIEQALRLKRASDTSFARDGDAQLEFVYEQTEYFEPEYRRYPVFRID